MTQMLLLMKIISVELLMKCLINSIKLSNRFKAKWLSLNLTKTSFIVFSNKHANAKFNITGNGTSIDHVYYTKF